jgi:hypothetical protein
VQFAQQAVTEIIVPNNVPFAPGNAVFGIGTQLPQELIDASISAAIVGYTGTYDPTRTTPQTKYYFIAIQDVPGTFSAFKIGQCIVTNAVSSQYGGLYDAFTSVKRIDNTNQNLSVRIGYDLPPGQWQAGDEFINLTPYIRASLTLNTIDLDPLINTIANVYGWHGIFYSSGWAAYSPAPQHGGRQGLFCRLDATGRVDLNGVLSQGAAVAANGELVGNLPGPQWRPPAAVSFQAQCNSGPGVFNFIVDPNGGIYCNQLGTQTPAGANQYYWVNTSWSKIST